jgi:HEAT repeat protein
MDITDLYDRIAAGHLAEDLPTEDARWVRKPLLERALQHVEAADAAARLGSLRVAGFLGPERALVVTAALTRDSDHGVRVSAFNQAVAAKEAGRPLLRDVLNGQDPVLIAASLDLLGRAGDRPVLNAARRLISHPDEDVRGAAARAIGMVGGPSASVALASRPDDTDAVAAAKSEALDWLFGNSPRPEAAAWWSDEPTPFPSAAPNAMPVHTAPLGGTSRRVPTNETASGPTAPEGQPDAPAVEPPSEPATTSLVPVHAPDDSMASESPSDGSGLPNPMPEEAHALLKLMGMVQPAMQDTVLGYIAALDVGEVSKQWIAWSPGGDPVLGRGIGLAAGRLKRQAFLSKAQAMAKDADPGVRAAAFEAIGHLAGASALVAVRQGINDAEPMVRVAALCALAEMGQRTERTGMTDSWIKALANDQDPTVAATVAKLTS